ncbi:MAG: Na+/H+ antiporter subunit D [Bacteroidetes bacterium]|nr:Na+/H+ antiporter subunit D [Bacteroidota bacterium]
MILSNILLPLLFAIVTAMLRKQITALKWSALIFAVALVVLNGIIIDKVSQFDYLVVQVGNWEFPHGITLAVDRLSAVMLFISSTIVLFVIIYSWHTMTTEYFKNYYLTFVFALLMGVNGAFTTSDLFNLYVWYEVMIMSSFVLITLGNTKEQLTGAVKYVTMNILSSLFFLAGIGLLYAKTGTLNMADLAQKLTLSQDAALINSTAILFFIGFGIKSAIFPLFFWLPASYHTPPLPITALFSGLLTKVGVYSLLRFLSIIYIHDKLFWQVFLLTIAGLTMVIGVLTAASQYEIRRILSFHIVSQIGYMILGLALFTPLGIAAAIYYMLHNIVAKTNAFLVAGLIEHQTGTFHLKKLGNLFKTRPWLALFFAIPALGLAGFPPFSGFIGKLSVIQASIESQQYIIMTVAVIVSFFTLFSMIKIWMEGFWKENQETDESILGKPKLHFSSVLPVAFMGIITIAMGLMAQPLFEFLLKASNQLLDMDGYYNALKSPL